MGVDSMNPNETAPNFSHGNIQIYKGIMEIINQTTDDYLYIFNIEQNEIQFFGSISQSYALKDNDSLKNTTAELLAKLALTL